MIDILYVKTRDQKDQFIYYLEEIKTNVNPYDVILIAPIPFQLSFDTLKAELLKIDLDIIHNTLLPLLENETITFSVDKNNTPIFNFNPEKHANFLGELAYLVMDGDQERFTITYLDKTLYIFDVIQNKYIYPKELSQDVFQDLYK